MPLLQPQPGPQTLATKSRANLIFFGGQAGGGKTYWGLLKLAMLAFLYPGLQAVVFRRTTPELKGAGSIWEKSWEIFPYLGFIAREGSDRDWRHPNGSVIEFRHMQHEKDRFDHQGREYHAVFFDEGTHFLQSQFFYLMSRLRNGPKHISGDHYMEPVLLTSVNPSPDSFIKGLVRWWLDANGQFADSDKAGVLRHCMRQGQELVWADKPEDLPWDGTEENRPRTVTFIPSKLADNKILMERDPGYRARLNLLLPHEYKALAEGDWNARAEAGDYFQRGWFRRWAETDLERRILGQPSARDIIASVRAWDLAATPVHGDLVPGIPRPRGFTAGKKDADWTRGAKLVLFRNGDMAIVDMASCRDTPGAVDELIKDTAQKDGPTTIIHLPQDPGQAGVDQVDRKKKDLRRYGRVESRVRSKNKEFYAAPVSKFCYSGRMWYLDGPWTIPFFNEIEAFPPDDKETHDDQVDVLADAFDVLNQPQRTYGYTKVADDAKIGKINDVRTTAGFRRRDLL